MIGYLAMVEHARFYRYPVSMLEGIASAANSLAVCEDPKPRGLKIGRVQFKNGRNHLIYIYIYINCVCKPKDTGALGWSCASVNVVLLYWKEPLWLWQWIVHNVA